MLNKNIETFIGCVSEYRDADIVLFGAPFDGTTSLKPGARFAPHTIRSQSFGLETYSPYQDMDLGEISVFDSGDLELCFGNSERVLNDIEKRVDTIITDHKFPFMIGGEHLVTLGAVRAAVRRQPDTHIIHIDAHTDLRDDYLGEKLSHATVIRRCHEITGDGKIYQFGIRSGERSEFLWSETRTHLIMYGFEGLPGIIEALDGAAVYLTVDLDVLDPSVFPGTGTPEAGGVGFDALRRAVTDICRFCRVVGCDVCELSPTYDPSGISTAAAAKIIREMLLALKPRGKQQQNPVI